MAGDAFLAVRALNDDRIGFDVCHAASHSQLNARAFDLLRGFRAELLAEGGEGLLAPIEQQHLRAGRIDPAEVALERSSRELGDLPGHLHAGGPGADHRERQPYPLGLGVLLHLGHLEGAEDARAKLEGIVDRLHPRSEAPELVMPEVGPRGTGRDDERVVGNRQRRPQRPHSGNGLRSAGQSR